jgi:hypothetical protein
MPEISRFFGIVIGMFWDDHRPPHFHVRYGAHEASVDIRDLTVIEGRLPSRVRGLVVEWADGHRAELLRNWNAVEKGKPLRKIPPLK